MQTWPEICGLIEYIPGSGKVAPQGPTWTWDEGAVRPSPSIHTPSGEVPSGQVPQTCFLWAKLARWNRGRFLASPSCYTPLSPNTKFAHGFPVSVLQNGRSSQCSSGNFWEAAMSRRLMSRMLLRQGCRRWGLLCKGSSPKGCITTVSLKEAASLSLICHIANKHISGNRLS